MVESEQNLTESLMKRQNNGSYSPDLTVVSRGDREAGDPLLAIALISAHLEMQTWKNDIIFDNLELPQICKKHFKGESISVSS